MACNKDCNISFSINESESDADMSFLSTLLDDIDNVVCQDLSFSMSVDYQVNFCMKQLLQICDYYGITKMAKCNKEFVINTIVNFELDAENADHVARRRLLWFYISELRNDRFMKKYIFW